MKAGELPPAPDEVEVTLLGPCYGESVLVHLGTCGWLIVDSCKDPATKNSAPIEYLKSIGVSSDSIQYIVISHWHDDHVAGIDEMIVDCPQAHIAISSSLTTKEANQLVHIYNNNTLPDVKGLSRFGKVMDYLDRTQRGIRRAQESTLLWRLNDGFNDIGEIWSLSPSDKRLDDSVKDFARLIPKAGVTRGRFPSNNCNDHSVVLYIKIGHSSILLGGDLEEHADGRYGWKAILSSAACPKERSSIFKVPHHGSQNGHSEDVWNSMLTQHTIALIAPFNKSSLPRASDIARIRGKAARTYLTADPGTTTAQIKRDSTVNKILKQTNIQPKPLYYYGGRVTCRKPIYSDAEWTISLSGGASKV